MIFLPLSLKEKEEEKMGLCPDLLRLIASFLPIQQIFPLLLELGDFTNEWFWQEKLMRDYPQAPLEQGLKFTQTYRKLYQKYHQYFTTKERQVIFGISLYSAIRDKMTLVETVTYGKYPCRLPGPVDSRSVYGVPHASGEIKEGSILCNNLGFTRNSVRFYLRMHGKWMNVEKIVPIEECDISYFSAIFAQCPIVLKLNLLPYMDQIRKNFLPSLPSPPLVGEREGNFYTSSFIDWKGIHHQLIYHKRFGNSLPTKWIYGINSIGRIALIQGYPSIGAIS